MNAKKLKEAYTTGTPWQLMGYEAQLLELRGVITDALTLRGQGRWDNYVMEKTAEQLNSFINDEFPNIRNKELAYILNLGISAELGQDTWVSGANIMKWVRMYSRHAERLAVIDEEEEERKANKRLTPEEIATRNKAAFEDSFCKARDCYSKTGTIFGASGLALPQWAAQIYQHYKAEDVIMEPTAEEWEKATAAARQAMIDNGLFAWKYKAEVLKVALDDWRDSFLLENYFKNNPIIN